MILRMGLVSLAALAVAATPAIAAAQATAIQASASNDDNKVVCKGETRANSRFKDKVCRTRAQWEELRAQQVRDARDFLDKPKIQSNMGG